ncbi:MAG: nicotinate (nicotinamide) nucleotide adenylyltransferase [Phycisphaeraceae bacterium]|nr:nicotinate (nicotinamide) nucleotide adenylyltransferase [Phycisphaeraceae bacterium]
MGTKLTPQPNQTVLLFGGSFDPPHRGHILLPIQAQAAINADHLAYIPVANQPHKKKQTPASHRLAMLKIALTDQPNSHILELELQRKGPSYTVETLRQLKTVWGNSVTLRLLIGADQLANFDHWKDWQQILTLAQPLVMQRQGQMPLTLPAGFNQTDWEKKIVQVDRMDISSTDLRSKLSQGKSIDASLIDPKVMQYIREHALYQG